MQPKTYVKRSFNARPRVGALPEASNGQTRVEGEPPAPGVR